LALWRGDGHLQLVTTSA